MNLVNNACEAVSDDGKVGITSLGAPERIEVCVRDNGPGIPEAIRGSLFAPFVSHGKQGGTGLGLALVDRLAKDHGGELIRDETGNEGTLFRVTLPNLVPPGGPPVGTTI